MGQKFTTAATTPPAQAATATAKALAGMRMRFSLRCDELTPALLARIQKARDDGSLECVTLDCRRSGFDTAVVDEVRRAAGGSKVVLDM